MSLFSSLKPKAQLSRNAFDKSRRDVFSCKTGMLTPCFVEHTIPDSVYDVNSVSILRTIPVQSAAFARMSQNVEYYFVPYSQIYRDFERLYYERGDNQRNIGNVQNPTQSLSIPVFSLKDVVGNFLKQYFYLRLYDEMKAVADEQVNPNCRFVLDDVYHNPNYIQVFFDVHGRICIEDMMRIFDLLGYGNYLPLCKFCYEYLCSMSDWSDLVEAAKAAVAVPSSGNIADAVNQFVNTGINETLVNSYVAYYDGVKPNVLALAAYLKVWSDMYRNSQYDVSVNYAYFFNFDYVVSDALAVVPVSKIFQLLIPRYRQWKKDCFTGSYPTAQFGSVAVAATENPVSIVSNATITGSTANANVLGATSTSPKPGTLVVPNGLGSGDRSHWNIDSSVSAIAIRQAMAFQKYKERILRAGNRVTALQTAMFGDRSRYLENNYCDFLGATHAPIDFNTVAATADTQTSQVGELAANGVATHGGSAFKYHAHDFGIIIGLFYVLPEAEYEAYMIDNANTTAESSDFYKSDFQNLGLQPVFNFDFNFMPPADPDSSEFTDSVLGYLARYWPLKTSIDKVHGEFYNSLPDSLQNYLKAAITYHGPINHDNLISTYVGAFAEFVTPRSSQAFRDLVLNSLYVEPTSVDSIFYRLSDYHQASDQFKVNFFHECKCVLPMSVVGLPV